MKTYKEMKADLKSAGESTKYFTKDFYNTFIEEYRTVVQNIINGIVADEYVKTKESDFYNKSSGSYCVFLEFFYGDENLQKFRITYSVDPWGNDAMTKYSHAEDESTMRELAIAEMDKNLFKFVEVMKVA